jgi:tetratricopeptide (TPR) repeat protein
MTKSKIVTVRLSIVQVLSDPFFFQIPGESYKQTEILETVLSKYNAKFGVLKGDIDQNDIIIQWKPEKLDTSAEQVHQSAIKLAKERHYDLAKRKWQQAIELNPSDVEYQYKLGLLYFELKQYQESIDILNRAVLLCPIHERAHLILGIDFIKLRKIKSAENHILHSRRLNFNNPLTYLNLGVIYSIQRRYDEAINMFQKNISLSPTEVRAYFGLGQIYSMLNDIEKANNQFEKVIELAPESKIAETAKLSIQSIAESKIDRAEILNVKKEEKIAQGISLYLLGEFKKAGNLYKDYLKFKPSDDFVWYLLSESILRQGQLSESADCLKKAIRTNPNRGLYYKTLGIVLHLQGKTSEAIKILKKAIDMGKQDPLCLTLLGINLLRAQKQEDAAQQLEKALKKDPNNPLAMYHLSLVYLKKKQNKDAGELIKKITDMKINFPVRKQALSLRKKLSMI